jgi:ribosome-associated protein
LHRETLKGSNLGNYKDLLQIIVEGLLEKKGKEIINIDLRKLDYAPSDNFIICHGDSGTQVKALAESVEDKVEKAAQLRLGHREGLDNAKWILLDYGHVIVHIFQHEARSYYKLEELWGDADIIPIEED